MSPTSRGRPKVRGRSGKASGRHPTRHRPPSEAENALHDIVAHSGELLGGTRIEAQLLASAWLGTAWLSRDLGARDTEAAFVHELLALVRRGRRPEWWTAAHVLATMPDDAWRADLVGTLAEAPPDAPRPSWAADPATVQPEPGTRARLWADPWGSERVYLVDYDEPEPHAMFVRVTTDGGVMVHEVVLGHQDRDLGETMGGLVLQGEQPVGATLTAVADALAQTDLYWPPQEAEDYVLTRAVAHWRTSGHRTDSDWEPIPDDERRRLLDEFAAAHGTKLGLEPSVVELLTDAFVDFGDGYLDGGVLAWSPGEVERFLTDWAQRKVLLEDDVAAELPRVLRVWVGFVLRRAGLAPEHIGPVMEAVDEFERDYLDGVAEGPGVGPGVAGELVAHLTEHGIDLDDDTAVAQGVSAFNAERDARTLLDGG
ncbi:MAG: hypothetical protein ACRCYR_10550 [Phycicoccus sp.]